MLSISSITAANPFKGWKNADKKLVGRQGGRSPLVVLLQDDATSKMPNYQNGQGIYPQSANGISALPTVSLPAPLRDEIEQVIDTVKQLVITSSTKLDNRFQRFMRRRFDPLFGNLRDKQLDDLTSGEEALIISRYEKQLNRNIGFAAIGVSAMLATSWLYPPALLIVAPPFIGLAFPIYQKAYAALRKERKINYHVLTAINVSFIWLGGFFVPAVIAPLLYYIAEKLLVITQDRSYKGLANIFGQQPKTLWLFVDGVEVEIPFDQVQAGDIIVINAGQMAPVDGVVQEGLATIDQHMLTGEAQPVEKAPGDLVYASTIVLAGKLLVKVEKAGQETVAAQIGAILNRTASYQHSLQSKGSALAHRLSPPTLAVGALAWLTLGLEQGIAILNSPLGASIRMTAPIAMLNFLNIASRSGILIKDGRSLELLSGVDTVLFDKTGTLTVEEPQVAAIHTVPGFTDKAVLRYAAAAEHRQTHPIARAIIKEAAVRNIALPLIDNARYEVGYGIKVSMEEKVICVGSDRFMTLEGVAIPEAIQAKQQVCQAEGHSLVMVAVDQQLAGAIELQPTIRPEAKEIVAELHRRGLTIAIISGDQEGPTRKLAQTLGIDQYFANTLPENKAALVEQLQQAGHAVCFVGDGINDSVALKKANVSVSLRGATTVATDTAQIVLMDQSLQQLRALFTLADEFDVNLKTGFVCAILPAVINIGGIFFWHWGLYASFAVYNLTMLNNLGIATFPLWRHRSNPLRLSELPDAKAVRLPSI